jgi:arsenite methyltransferase
MQYEGDLATLQRRLAQTSDLARRRLAVLEALAAQPGEAVLEVGCGGGALLPSLAASVAPSGRVVGIDQSTDQIAAAGRLCAGVGAVETAVQDLRQLPYGDAGFDAVVAVQVIEYLDQPAAALSELRRVIRMLGRLVLLATNWDTVLWNCGTPELTRRVQEAWRGHAPHPNLPAELWPLLEGAGFRIVRQSPVTILNAAYHEDAFAYWAARLMAAFGVGRNMIFRADGEAWLKALEDAQAAGRFFFSSTPVLTLAVAA